MYFNPDIFFAAPPLSGILDDCVRGLQSLFEIINLNQRRREELWLTCCCYCPPSCASCDQYRYRYCVCSPLLLVMRSSFQDFEMAVTCQQLLCVCACVLKSQHFMYLSLSHERLVSFDLRLKLLNTLFQPKHNNKQTTGSALTYAVVYRKQHHHLVSSY